MTAANPHRGEIIAQIGGDRLLLRPTFEAITEWETATGAGSVRLARKLASGDVSMADIVDILTAATRPTNPNVKHAEIGRMISAAGLLSAIEPVQKLLMHALTGGLEPGEAVAADQT